MGTLIVVSALQASIALISVPEPGNVSSPCCDILSILVSAAARPTRNDMASEPLLGDQPAADGNVEAQYLLDEQPDFAQVISADPDSVIAHIEQKGVQDLGTFKVQVRPCELAHREADIGIISIDFRQRAVGLS